MALRVGAEDKKKVYLASGLGLVVLILLLRFLWQTFGPSPSVASPPAPVVTEAPSSAQRNGDQQIVERPYSHEASKVSSYSSLDPTLHPEVMRQAESLEYTGNGRNIFSQFSAPPEIPKPIASARQRAAEAEALAHAGPPPPPPIDLRFYGYAAERGGKKQVFLLKGDDIFIASQGDVVDRRYRVGQIGATSVQVEDLPFHDTQTLPLVQ